MITVEPTRDFPVPFDLSDEEASTHKDKITIAANTAALIGELGGTFELSDADEHAAHALIKGAKDIKTARKLTVPAVARKLHLLLSEYDHQVIKDAQQGRTYITNRLVELSQCGDPKVELKALELLGKHSDIGLFTERSEITITHKTSTDLENSIKERIKRLLNADVVDVLPISDLDKQLGSPLEVLEQVSPIEEDEDD
jgi:hypothetical protein